MSHSKKSPCIECVLSCPYPVLKGSLWEKGWYFHVVSGKQRICVPNGCKYEPRDDTK